MKSKAYSYAFISNKVRKNLNANSILRYMPNIIMNMYEKFKSLSEIQRKTWHS